MKREEGSVENDTLPVGTLFIVATPIGNLEDITLRALRVLRGVDWIAAEDTRRARKLLTFYGISKRVFGLYGGVERERAPALVKRLAEGERGALVSEAGTPGASDPGAALVAAAAAAGVRVTPVPGASAVAAAASAAGIPASRFAFEGFLPRKGKERRERIEGFRDDRRAAIFFESPLRVRRTLGEIYRVAGDRRIAIFREMTKFHEEITYTDLASAAGGAVSLPEKGEYTIVMEGSRRRTAEKTTFDLEEFVRVLRGHGMSARDAAAIASRLTGVPKKDAYASALKFQT
ncbi:MAG: 16S rRNA (cytidine(1402)-2'-O)-methyltransferase [bacterium]